MIQMILKINMHLKPEAFLWAIIYKQLEKSQGTLFLYMVTAARLLYAQRWKEPISPTMEEWMIKMMELVKMAKLTFFIREKTLRKFMVDWKSFLDLCRTEKDEFMTWFQ